MARKVRDKKLDSKAERGRLSPSPNPYYREIGRGLHLGFRKGQKGGSWVVRMYAGARSYKVESIGHADDDLTDANGVSVLTFDQAVEQARELQKARTTSAGEVVGPYTVKQAVADYLDHIASKASAYDHGKRADASILPALGPIDTAMLTAKQIRQWLQAEAAKPPRARSKKGGERQFRDFDANDPNALRKRRNSANRTLTVLKAALNFGFQETKIPSDAAWKRVKSLEDADAAKIRALTVAESTRLLNACLPDFQLLVRAALETGCRYGELARLKVEDFAAGKVDVWVSKSGKKRHVSLTPEGQEFFRRACAGRGSQELIFRQASGEPWKASSQGRPMAAACDAAKIEPAISFHILRHTWATLAITSGVIPMAVARNLGHADTRMVEKHYGHLPQSYVDEQVAEHGPRFGPLEPTTVVPLHRER